MNFRGGGAKPVEKPVQKPSAGRFAHPLRGAEVLVAVRGRSPGEGGGKKKERKQQVEFLLSESLQVLANTTKLCR